MTNTRSRTYSPLVVALGVFLLPVVLYYELPKVLNEVGAAFVQPDFHVELSIASSSLLLAFCIAGLAMALVQVSRTLIPFRGYFHEEQLRAWLGDSLEDATVETAPLPVEKTPPWWSAGAVLLKIERPSVDAALKELQRSDKNATSAKKKSSFDTSLLLYDLPIEQLSGQLNLAFEAAIDEPSRFANLFLLLVGPEGVPYLDEIVPPSPPEQVQTQTQTTSARREVSELEDAAKRARALKQAQARSSVTRICQSRIDAFQITAGGKWRRWLRLVAVAVSIGLSGAICFTSVFRQPVKATPSVVVSHSTSYSVVSASIQPVQEDGPTVAQRIGRFFAGLIQNVGLLLYALMIGIVAAYLAMLLRDFTAIVENKRRRA